MEVDGVFAGDDVGDGAAAGLAFRPGRFGFRGLFGCHLFSRGRAAVGREDWLVFGWIGRESKGIGSNSATHAEKGTMARFSVGGVWR